MEQSLPVIVGAGKLAAQPGRSDKKRGWGFTINNYTMEDITLLNAEPCVYKCWVFHEAPTTKTPHMHVYLYYKSCRYFQPLQKRYPRAHFEWPLFHHEAWIEYILAKGDDVVGGPYEFGEKPEQGRRTDLELIAKKISNDKASMELIAEDHPVEFIRYHKGLQALRHVTVLRDRPRGILEVFWIYGKAGTGKSKMAYEWDEYPPYIKDSSKWWDGYNGEERVIIDDLDASKYNYRDLLRLLDKWYPYSGEVKGGYIKIAATMIFITCEHPPNEIWSNNELVQVERRIDHLIEKCKMEAPSVPLLMF